jgi:hypothetical protein
MGEKVKENKVIEAGKQIFQGSSSFITAKRSKKIQCRDSKKEEAKIWSRGDGYCMIRFGKS